MYFNIQSKEIATAFAVLSDESNRRRYDEYGESLGPTHTHRREYNDFEREFEGLCTFLNYCVFVFTVKLKAVNDKLNRKACDCYLTVLRSQRRIQQGKATTFLRIYKLPLNFFTTVIALAILESTRHSSSYDHCNGFFSKWFK